jgi:hypothetical protein
VAGGFGSANADTGGGFGVGDKTQLGELLVAWRLEYFGVAGVVVIKFVE